MRQSAKKLILVLMLISIPIFLCGQQSTPFATWLLPGISWQVSKSTRLRSQAGYSHYLGIRLVYPQAYITVHKNIVLNPAYIYALQEKKGLPTIREHSLMNAIILQNAWMKWFIDNRIMLWDRLMVGDKATHYYRNRLRIIQSFKMDSLTIKPYVYDETFYLFNNHCLSRNRIAFGFINDLTRKINIDFAYVRQWDRYAGKLNLFYINFIWQW